MDEEFMRKVASGEARIPGFVVYGDGGYDCELAKRSVGPGWHSLLDQIFDAKPNNVIIEQVKEKYSWLTIYHSLHYEYDNETGEVLNPEIAEGKSYEAYEAFSKMVEVVEYKSGTICEECGQKGKFRSGGWYRTLCDEHALEFGYKID
jgi:hypothetical protein